MKHSKCEGQPENGVNRCLERRAGMKGRQTKRKTTVLGFGALSLVLSLDEQRKNKRTFGGAKEPNEVSLEKPNEQLSQKRKSGSPGCHLRLAQLASRYGTTSFKKVPFASGKSIFIFISFWKATSNAYKKINPPLSGRTFLKGGRPGSNRRPPDPQSGALTS